MNLNQDKGLVKTEENLGNQYPKQRLWTEEFRGEPINGNIQKYTVTVRIYRNTHDRIYHRGGSLYRFKSK